MHANKKRKISTSSQGPRQTTITNFFTKLKTENSLTTTKVDVQFPKTETRGFQKETSSIVSKSVRAGGSWSNFGNKNRVKSCPPYKVIPDTPFAVDAFSYGAIPGISYYFLSHFHADHYNGLTGKFKQTLCCNKVTANLVKLKLRVRDDVINLLPMNEAFVINGIEITLIDANHCPGSAMFLFKYSNGRILLHTGDFRADAAMEVNPFLIGNRINLLYLDTTYCKPMYHFPDQQSVLDNTVKIARKYYGDNERTLFVCGSYTIGKEKVFIAIAKALQLKTWANKEKMKIFHCLEDESLTSTLTPVETEANIHVLPLGQVNFEFLGQYILKFKGIFNQIVGLKPSGWEFNSKNSTSDFKFRRQGNIIIYGIPYSEHSSYNELQQFVKFVQPDRIIPTVNTGGKEGKTTQEILLRWTKNCPDAQQSLDAWTQQQKLC